MKHRNICRGCFAVLLASTLVCILFTSSVAAPIRVPGKGGEISPQRPVGWRGDWMGSFPDAAPPIEWSQKAREGGCTSKNIKWKTRLPFQGAASPIVVGDRVFLCGCIEHSDGDVFPLDLACFSREDGRLLWLKSHTYFDAASEEDKKKAKDAEALNKKLEQLTENLVKEINEIGSKPNRYGNLSEVKGPDGKLLNERRETAKQIAQIMSGVDVKKYAKQGRNDFGWASHTACSDGKHVYVFFASRVAACYDMEGKRKWIILQPEERLSNTEHGTHGSPVLVDGKFVIPYAKLVVAIEAATGKLLWTQEIQDAWGIAYSSLAPGSLPDKDKVIVVGHGQGVRLSDGKQIWGRLPGNAYAGENTTPVISGDTIYMYERSGIKSIRMPASSSGGILEILKWYKFPKDEPVPSDWKLTYEVKGLRNYQVASPLFSGGLVYCLSDQGVIYVFDPKTGDIVYRKLPDFKVVHPGASASPAFAGGCIFFMDNQGNTCVVKPGRKFEQVSFNTIESFYGGKDARQERFLASPFFAGKDVLIRGENFLYCISGK